MRGKLDLGTHKLANVFRPPAERQKWKRARMEKRPSVVYVWLWGMVAGAVRDTFACHPEYLTEAGRKAAERSITKRVTGTLYGYATQVAWGPSMGAQDAVRDLGAKKTAPAPTWRGWFARFSLWARNVAAGRHPQPGRCRETSPKIRGGGHENL